MIVLTSFDLALASLLVVLTAVLSWWMRVGLEKQIIIAALRTTVQLLLLPTSCGLFQAATATG